MNETTENFFQALSEWKPQEPQPIFFRLYYDDQGLPVAYSMEQLPYKYIELTAEQYQRSPPNVRVVDGKIIEIKPPVVTRKLVPGATGTSCAVTDICVVVKQEPSIKWDLKTYEQN